MADSPLLQPPESSLAILVAGLDPLMIATGLALASLTPGPAGEAGAIAAIAYDLAQKRWYGVALSATSMVPVFGYLPAFVKVGLLLFLLSHRLKALEARLPEIHTSPEALLMVESALGKYYRKLPDVWLTRSLRKRLEMIMALDKQDQTMPLARDECPSKDTSMSTQSPK